LPREFQQTAHTTPHDEHAQRLLRIALPILQTLREELSSSSLVLYLGDRTGRVIYREGNTRILCAADRINRIPGAQATENMAGTNGLGTALFLRQPIQLDLAEHFCESFFE
jgi:transcriptional regulator of acetoin/glycerol metabolism